MGPGLEIQFLPNFPGPPPPTTGCADPCGDLDGVLELTLVCRVHILEPYIHTYENMTHGFIPWPGFSAWLIGLGDEEGVVEKKKVYLPKAIETEHERMLSTHSHICLF